MNFLNPITMAFNLLNAHTRLLEQNLSIQGIGEEIKAQILKSLTIENQLYFSLNRRYQKSSLTKNQFFEKENIDSRIADRLTHLKYLYIHQEHSIHSIVNNRNVVLSTGTGSGKTETFLIPIIDHCLKNPGSGVKALIIYPMNALANDQIIRINKYTTGLNISFGVFVGSTPENQNEKKIDPIDGNTFNFVYRSQMRETPPDILVTNYVMLERMLTSGKNIEIFNKSKNSLKFLVLDEIHTYRGNKATDLNYLLRRFKFELKNNLIHIGTSATLRKNRSEGYLTGEAKIPEFICNLFDVSEYDYIEPTYENISNEVILHKEFEPKVSNGWKLQLNLEEGINNINNLTGRDFKEWDLKDEIKDSQIFQSINLNKFINELRSKLELGSLNFVSMGKLLSRITTNKPEELLKSYLSAIAFLNHIYDSNPVLDFRTHLFIRNLSGYLKRCIKCSKYFAGGKKYCDECGNPLFAVYKQDPSKTIGKISNQKLKFELYEEDDDERNSYYVLIERIDQPSSYERSLSFKEEFRISKNEILLDYAQYGKLKIHLLKKGDMVLTVKSINTAYIINNLLVKFSDEIKEDYLYLENIVRSILDFHQSKDKKVLGFIDNREQASRYSSVLQDEFIDRFFIEFTAWALRLESSISVKDAYSLLKNRITALSSDFSSEEAEIFKEYEQWFCRRISIPPRYANSYHNVIYIDSQNLDEELKKIIEIFIAERAFGKMFRNDFINAKAIKFFRKFAMDPKFISLPKKNTQGLDEIKSNEYPSISLNPETARLYGDVLAKKSLEQFRELIDKLISKGFIHLLKDDNADKDYYYLNINKVLFRTGEMIYSDYEELKNKFMLTSELHSSEVESADRITKENCFRKGHLNFLLATPTLEMGIDIGELVNIIMVGIPPLPSNYAQRAGRAGRNTSNNYALIVNICELVKSKINHDEFYYSNPNEMIDGVINPPTFNKRNFNIVQKHINAFLFSKLKNRNNNTESELVKLTEEVTSIYKDLFSSQQIKQYVGESVLNNYCNQHQFNHKTINQLYKMGIMPDYSFSKDNILLLSEDQFVKIKSDDQMFEDLDLKDISITGYDIEEAVFKYIPNTKIYAQGSLYNIIADYKQSYETVNPEVNLQREIREYKYFIGREERDFITKKYTRGFHETAVVFEVCNDVKDFRGILKAVYQENAKIMFKNNGKEDLGFFDRDEKNYTIQYTMNRSLIAFALEDDVCKDESYIINFISALERAIKDYYYLDESDIKVYMGAKLERFESVSTDEYRYVILYDGTGNGNINFKSIFDNLENLFRMSYEKIRNCSCEKNLNKNSGCYLCIRTYNTQFYSNLTNRKIAMMLMGYLASVDGCYFQPSVEELSIQTISKSNLVFEIIQDPVLKIRTSKNPDGYTFNTLYNSEELFKLMMYCIIQDFDESYKGLTIRSKNSTILQPFQENKVAKHKELFAELRFNLLRFSSINAEKL